MIVYKYRPVDKYTLELLINNEFHLSYPEDFNDPFDCYMKIKFQGSLNDFLIMIKESGGEITKEYILNKLGVRDQNFEDVKNNIGVFKYDSEFIRKQRKMSLNCFTTKNNSILMWSHYSNCHKGLTFGFQTTLIHSHEMLFFEPEVNQFLPSFPTNSYPLFKVKYDKIPEEYNVGEKNHEKFVDFAITKSPEWSYEEEYRLIFLQEFWSKNKIKFSKDILKEIIFGLETTDEDKKTIRKIIQDNYISKGYDIKFFQCERKKDEYGLNIVQID